MGSSQPVIPNGNNNNNNKKKKKNLLLARKNDTAAPPTETTKLLAAMLDVKQQQQRPKKRSKQQTGPTATTTAAASSTAAKPAPAAATTAWSRHLQQPASAVTFGVKTGGLSMSSNSLKRKPTSSSQTSSTTAAILGKHKHNGKRKGRQDEKENNTAASTKGRTKKKPPSSTSVLPTTNTTTTRPDTTRHHDGVGRYSATSTPKESAASIKTVPASHRRDQTRPLPPTNHNPYKQQSQSKVESTTVAPTRQEEEEQDDPPIFSLPTTKPKLSTEEAGTTKNIKTISQSTTRNSTSQTSSTTNKDSRRESNKTDGTTLTLGLNLKAAQRRKRSRSLPSSSSQMQLSESNTHNKSDLAVLGAMLSSSTTLPAATNSTTTTTTTTTTLQQTQQQQLPTTSDLFHQQYDPHKESLNNNTNHEKATRLLPPMKALLAGVDTTATDESGGDNNNTNNRLQPPPSKKHRSNDNFVRQNLRNSAGACRGARNKKRKFSKYNNRFQKSNNYKYQGDYNTKNRESDDEEQDCRPPAKKETIQRAETFRAGVDPLDDYLDGVLKDDKKTATKTATKKGGASKKKDEASSSSAAPKCTRHQRPCKLLTVKKTTTGNKGRKFYACSMPRGEQCDHFQWADDTIEAAKTALLKNSSHSGFMARQVAAYSERFKKLTVPELRETCKKRNLDTSGKKQQLLLRLSIWVRDELATAAPDDAKEESEADNVGETSKSPEPSLSDGKRPSSPNSQTKEDSDDGLVVQSEKKASSSATSFTQTLDISGLAVAAPEIESGGVDSDDSSCTSSEDELEILQEGSSGRVGSSDAALDAAKDDAINRKADSSTDGEDDREKEAIQEDLKPSTRGRITTRQLTARNQPEEVDVDSSNSEDEDDSENEDECCEPESGEPTTEPRKALRRKPENPNDPIQSLLFSLFGYTELRDGQEWAIKRSVEKQKTLLVAPTGFGKSMCYVLPAAMMEGVTIVVSPLISLIQDQLRELPPRVPAATLSGSLTTAATAAIVDDVIRKRIKVLFVSPERLASASFQRLFQPKWNKVTNTYERPFPPVSLLCVDEAHCLSQWAHNFRPSYLRLRSLLNKVEPQSVLAITATAGRQVVNDICRTLKIQRCDAAMTLMNESCKTQECSCGVWAMKSDRENINVESFIVKSQELRLTMLVNLLKPAKAQTQTTKKRNKDKGFVEGRLARGSVIVYVWRQRDAEVVAESIQASGVSGGVVFYHGGMDSGSRSNAYSKFMRGKARICVATVAFGLGVNKPDIAGIVHMYLPASPEHYLQEIGRAGRDGRAASAIALIVEEEALVRHSQAHSDLIARSQVRSILYSFSKAVRKVIDSLPCDHWSQVPAIGVAVPLDEIGMMADLKPETVETIFSLLELREESYTPSVQVEGTSIDQLTISLKRRTLSKLAESEAIAKCIQTCGICVDRPAGEEKPEEDGKVEHQERENSRHQQFAAYSFGSHRFSVTQCANLLGPAAQPRHAFAALRRLQMAGEIELQFDKTSAGRALRVILNNSGLRMFLERDENDFSALDEMADSLAEELTAIARVSANKVLDINYIMHKVSDAVKLGPDEEQGKARTEKSESLKLFQKLARLYFDCGENERLSGESLDDLPLFVNDFSEKEILIDSLALVSDLMQQRQNVTKEEAFLMLGDPGTSDYTALAITKFFHGMATVRAPLATSRHHRLFGKWQGVRFDKLLETVQHVLAHAN